MLCRRAHKPGQSADRRDKTFAHRHGHAVILHCVIEFDTVAPGHMGDEQDDDPAGHSGKCNQLRAAQRRGRARPAPDRRGRTGCGLLGQVGGGAGEVAPPAAKPQSSRNRALFLRQLPYMHTRKDFFNKKKRNFPGSWKTQPPTPRPRASSPAQHNSVRPPPPVLGTPGEGWGRGFERARATALIKILNQPLRKPPLPAPTHRCGSPPVTLPPSPIRKSENPSCSKLGICYNTENRRLSKRQRPTLRTGGTGA